MLENKGERVGCSLGVWERMGSSLGVWERRRNDRGIFFLILFLKILFYSLSTKYLMNLNPDVKKLHKWQVLSGSTITDVVLLYHSITSPFEGG